MGFIAETGMAAFHYDSKNGAAESMEKVEGRIALVGNINNPETLFAKNPDDVKAEVFANLASRIRAGERAFVVVPRIDGEDGLKSWRKILEEKTFVIMT